ncbi:MAG: DUF6134 family protein [Planctomycetota bacterium]|jgi:hypothetical protein
MVPSTSDIAFMVFRDDDALGHHTVSFRRDADLLHVEIDILLEVKLAFITLFRYQHRNHEVWRDGRLVAIETRTDDDGDDFWLRGRSTDAGFRVEGSSGAFVAPADILPTSYWRPDTTTRTQLLETQRGRLIEVAVSAVGVESITVAGGPVDAERYSVTGDLTLDLWYTAGGEWAKTRFEARGAEVIYRRVEASAVRADIHAR